MEKIVIDNISLDENPGLALAKVNETKAGIGKGYVRTAKTDYFSRTGKRIRPTEPD